MIENITSEIEKSTSKITYQRARAALPILVRQAIVGKEMTDKEMTLTYKQLGEEIDAHHRGGVVPVLFCIEKLLAKLGEHWQEKIPAIQGIVVNQKTRLPGNSVAFLRKRKLDPRDKERLVKENFTDVRNYQKWEAILEELGLPMPQKISQKLLQAAAQRPSTHESPAHQQLKKYVAQNPQCVNVGKSLAPGIIEKRLPSGDIPDVLFKNKRQRIAVEVKSRISNENEGDLLRGLFQCVKYRAILKAQRNLKGKTYKVDARLAIEGILPNNLAWVKNMLKVKVFENIQVSNV